MASEIVLPSSHFDASGADQDSTDEEMPVFIDIEVESSRSQPVAEVQMAPPVVPKKAKLPRWSSLIISGKQTSGSEASHATAKRKHSALLLTGEQASFTVPVPKSVKIHAIAKPLRDPV